MAICSPRCPELSGLDSSGCVVRFGDGSLGKEASLLGGYHLVDAIVPPKTAHQSEIILSRVNPFC